MRACPTMLCIHLVMCMCVRETTCEIQYRMQNDLVCYHYLFVQVLIVQTLLWLTLITST